MELTLQHLSKQYGIKKAVDNISNVLKPGVYGLLGANGAGKTTFAWKYSCYTTAFFLCRRAAIIEVILHLLLILLPIYHIALLMQTSLKYLGRMFHFPILILLVC